MIKAAYVIYCPDTGGGYWNSEYKRYTGWRFATLFSSRQDAEAHWEEAVEEGKRPCRIQDFLFPIG